MVSAKKSIMLIDNAALEMKRQANIIKTLADISPLRVLFGVLIRIFLQSIQFRGRFGKAFFNYQFQIPEL